MAESESVITINNQLVSKTPAISHYNSNHMYRVAYSFPECVGVEMVVQHYQFGFRNVEGGTGSYGGVCKARCDGLPCAAKIMHPTLLDPGNLKNVICSAPPHPPPPPPPPVLWYL